MASVSVNPSSRAAVAFAARSLRSARSGAPGKVAYLFGDLTPADLPDLVTFAAAYHASCDGTFADARFMGALRTKAIARIPG
jgi:predicted metal-binding protein